MTRPVTIPLGALCPPWPDPAAPMPPTGRIMPPGAGANSAACRWNVTTATPHRHEVEIGHSLRAGRSRLSGRH